MGGFPDLEEPANQIDGKQHRKTGEDGRSSVGTKSRGQRTVSCWPPSLRRRTEKSQSW